MSELNLNFLNKNENPGLKMSREAIISFLFQVIFAAISFLTMALLTRLLGTSEYGAYTNAIAWANTLAFFAPFGLSVLLVREVAVLKSNHDLEGLKGLLRFSDYFVIIFSVLTSAILIFLTNRLLDKQEDQFMVKAIIAATPLVSLWAYTLVQQSILRGIEKPIHAQLPDLVIRPALTLGLIFIFFLSLSPQLESGTVIIISIISSSISLFFALLWRRKFVFPIVFLEKPKYEIPKWMKSTIPLFFYNASQVVIAQAPLILLGIINTPASVGFFNVAFRLSSILLYLPLAIGMVLGPVTARLYFQNQTSKLQGIFKLSTTVIFVTDLLIFIIFIIFGQRILNIFGNEFVPYFSALIILVTGNLIDGALGNSSLLLNMCGFEKWVATINGAAAVTFIILSLAVIPKFGVFGTALLFTLVLTFVRVSMTFFIAFRLKMNITIFPLRSIPLSVLKSVFNNG